ncbi:hypothetical protein K439DRAFT_200108 [Ramaria rubella]|nr:hypothetical protein K439DRAFT_200108 [Ramaria rubella]
MSESHDCSTACTRLCRGHNDTGQNSNKVARNNLCVKLGNLCNVQPCHDIKYSKQVCILPFDNSIIEGLSGNIFEVYLNLKSPPVLAHRRSVSFGSHRHLLTPIFFLPLQPDKTMKTKHRLKSLVRLA